MFFIPQGAARLTRNLAIQPDAFSEGGRDILLQRPAELRAGGTFLLDDASGVFLSLLQSRVEIALWQGQQEVYEYGVESQLASALSSLIVEYGVLGVRATGRALASAAATDETACEILRHLGAMNDPRTRTDRIRILAQHLHSASPRRRYAAAIGLADTNAPEAIALLRDAIQGEPMEELKRRFRRFIALLRP